MAKIFFQIDETPDPPWTVCQGCRDYVAPAHRCPNDRLDLFGNPKHDAPALLDELNDALERVRDSLADLSDLLSEIR